MDADVAVPRRGALEGIVVLFQATDAPASNELLRVSPGLTCELLLVAMCDSRDISGVVDSKNLGRPAMIMYDRYPGGLGYCEKGFFQIDQLLAICRQMVYECPCDDGCPSCVGLPNLRPAIHSDPDLMRGYPIPDKTATQRLLELLTETAEVRQLTCVSA